MYLYMYKYICTLSSKILYVKYNCLIYQQFKFRNINLFDETLWIECTKEEMCFFSILGIPKYIDSCSLKVMKQLRLVETRW